MYATTDWYIYVQYIECIVIVVDGTTLDTNGSHTEDMPLGDLSSSHSSHNSDLPPKLSSNTANGPPVSTNSAIEGMYYWWISSATIDLYD